MGSVRREGRKVYIEDVRRVSWDTGEMCEFASCLASALGSLGDETLYHFVMGTSGAAFRFTLNPGQWDFTNYGIRNITPDAYAPIRRAFNAAGRAFTTCGAACFQEDASRMADSIDRGIPVLAFRVVGPSDCCILTGYDEDRKVLLEWSTFQDIPDDHDIPHDGTGYFRKPGWHENLAGYVLIGERASRPAFRSTYLNAIEWAVHLMRAVEMKAKVTGLEGLRVWAGEMTQQEFFPVTDEAVMGQRCVSAAINMTMLRDHCQAEPFLRQAAADVPDLRPELSRAFACYGEVRRIRDGMDDLIADDFSERAMKAICEAETRQRYADAILRIHDAEQEAADQLQRLVERCA